MPRLPRLHLGRLPVAHLLAFTLAAHAAEIADPNSTSRGVTAASDEGQRAIASFAASKGLQIELIAAEPLLANPVAFSIDEQGRFYVVETFRLGAGVLDIRGRRGWPNADYKENLARERSLDLAGEVLDTDLAVGHVDDRLAYLKNFFGNNARPLASQTDRIRLLHDTNGDRKPDRATVFADGFNRAEDGLASGVLSRRGEVWFTNIPDLWWLRDRNGDGVADERRALRSGFGVRTGFLGHDLHGLTFGPDGRLYFTIGDRAANVPIEGGASLVTLDSGAVFSCRPDGTDMEIFATGLRNPQELVFDLEGNLFTGDNNSDGGDQARWVHLVEGGDSGWRIGYQFLEGSDALYHRQARGPWNAEKMWHPRHDDQPAFFVPPIANLGNGPSGVAFNPGTGLPDRWKNHFFMVDFKGQPNLSGVHAFTLQPDGASFKLAAPERLIWNILATDIEFGVDAGLYVLDWVQGWGVTGKGRIYRVFDPALDSSATVAETRRLLAEGMTQRPLRELARWLGHTDYRVRLDAQFELVRRGDAGLKELARAARQTTVPAARLHGVWGLGQIAREFAGQVTAFAPRREAVATLLALLQDPHPTVRAQAAKALGDARAQEALTGLTQLATDPHPAVRFHAVMGLGKLNQIGALPAVLAMLRANRDADPLLRHAGVMALTAFNDRVALNSAAKDTAPAVRMASLLAMRRLRFDDIAQFLDDPEPRLVREAARAINDGPVHSATLALAQHTPKDWNDAVLVSRVVNANLRAGTAQHARRLATLASDTTKPEPARQDALLALASWSAPSGRDRVTGVWHPLIASTRDAAVPTLALQPHLPALLAAGPETLQLAAVQATSRLRIRDAAHLLLAVVRDAATQTNAPAAPADATSSNTRRRRGSQGRSVPVEALLALETLATPELVSALNLARPARDEALASAASSISARAGYGNALHQVRDALAQGSTFTKQSAIRTLADIKSDDADAPIWELLEQLRSGRLPIELAVDVLDTASNRGTAALSEIVKIIETGDGTPLAPYRFALAGGQPEAGRGIAHEREDVACIRCHQIAGVGGEVGPKLDGVASRLTPQQLLEAIVTPNATIAAGFETVIIIKHDGGSAAGIVKSEDDRQLVLLSPEDGLLTIPRADIKSRNRGASGMPDGMGQILGRADLRNLLAYLATLK